MEQANEGKRQVVDGFGKWYCFLFRQGSINDLGLDGTTSRMMVEGGTADNASFTHWHTVW